MNLFNWGPNANISGNAPLNDSPFTYWNSNFIRSGFTALIPAMTNYTAPNGTASASNDSSTYCPAWGAFDRSDSQYWASSDGSNFYGPPQWIQYQFPSTKIVKAYSFSSLAGNTVCSIINWNLLGSNDGTNFTLLDTRYQPQSTSRFTIDGGFYQITNKSSYNYYRMYITNSSSPFINFVFINSLQMYSQP
jgi:hypothetical protein